MAYTLGNKCAKNLCKRIVLLQLIIENVVTCFFGTQCTSVHYSPHPQFHKLRRDARISTDALQRSNNSTAYVVFTLTSRKINNEF